MSIARRNMRVQHITPSASWKWYGSALDSTGGNMNVVYDGTAWYTGVDIAGVTRMQPDGTMPQWQKGRGYSASDNPEEFLIKCAAMNSDGTTAWVITGTDNGGGIQKRTVASGSWQLMTTAYRGDVSATIGVGRIVGHRRILDLGANGVFFAVQRDSDNKGGIIRTINGGSSFSEFHNASGFTIGRVFSGLIASEQGYSNMFYACAESPEVAMSPANDNPIVGVYTNINGTPTFTRIDDAGSGPPSGGIADARTMICIDEGGKDTLYVLVGKADTTNGGLWRCVIQSDPNSWGATPDVAWTKLNAGVLQASHAYRVLTGRRSGGTTQIVVGSSLTSGSGQASLGGSIPGSGSSFEACVYRSLNAQAASPTWEAVSGPANILDTGELKPMYGTASERWVMSRATQDNNTNNSILGGGGWIPFDMDIDEATGTVVVAGKSGSWISENPWAATASSVAWRAFSNSTGGVLNSHVAIHPTDNLKWTMNDVDRAGYFNLDGASGQMQGIKDINAGQCHANYIRQGGSAPGKWIIGSSTGVYWSSTNWNTTTDPDILPSFAQESTGGGDLMAVAEITFASVEYKLAVDAGGKLLIKAGAGAWANPYTFPTPSGEAVTVIVNDGHQDFWVFEPGSGIRYFSDITNVPGNPPVLMCAAKPLSSEKAFFGRVAQDATNRTTLYATFGKNAATTGVWKFTGADDLQVNASCVKTAGTGTVSRMTGGPLATGTRCGAIAVDPDDGSVIVTVIPYSTGTADVLHFDGTQWTSIGDSLYAEVGVLPMWIAKKGNRIYTSQYASGTPFAKYE